MPDRPAVKPSTDPVYVDRLVAAVRDPLDLDALIECAESTASVLSMEPTAFQLEQAVDFLVATVPFALRRMKDEREALVAVARAAHEEHKDCPLHICETCEALSRLDGAR